jgi:CBS domain-containing protein
MIKDLAKTTVESIGRRHTVTVSPETRLAEAVEKMHAGGRGGALVQNKAGRLVGIFTERDFLTRVDHANLDWQRLSVAEVMTREIVCVAARSSAVDALRLMNERTIRSLPIVRDGRPIGMISTHDILRYVAESYPRDFINLPPDPSLATTPLWGG